MNDGQQLICVIEDILSIRKLYKVILEKNNYSVIEFEEGNKAIEWLASNKPTAIICDDLLPDSNGKETIKAIRNLPNGKNLPVIAVTGFAHVSDRERYISMGFDGYISKPINTSSFIEELLQFLPPQK